MLETVESSDGDGSTRTRNLVRRQGGRGFYEKLQNARLDQYFASPAIVYQIPPSGHVNPRVIPLASV